MIVSRHASLLTVAIILWTLLKLFLGRKLLSSEIRPVKRFLACLCVVCMRYLFIFRILKPGGIWVNLGPLLYHFSDIQGENSIEPTFENLELIIKMVGFEFLRCQTGMRTKYAQNPQSMLKSEYESLFWVCRKPENAIDNTDDLSQRDDDIDESGCGGNSSSNTNNHYVDIYSNGYKNAYQHQ